MRTNQSGFTIIELIVVIALLGILSAVALPRFINVTDEAHIAAVEGGGAGFATGLALLKAQVVANGDLGGTDVDDVAGYGEETLDVNSNGYAVATGGAGSPNSLTPPSAVECANLWNALFDANGPTASNASGTSIDYVSTLDSAECVYTYKEQGSGSRVITYTASTGAASVVAN